MTPAAILTAVLTYGPQILPLISTLKAWIETEKKEVSAEDIQFLINLANKKSEDYLK